MRAETPRHISGKIDAAPSKQEFDPTSYYMRMHVLSFYVVSNWILLHSRKVQIVDGIRSSLHTLQSFHYI